MQIKIKRLKSKNKNIYEIDGKQYSSFGQDVPEDIKKILNLSSLNLQGQHEAPFLLASSAGEVAKYLNKIVNLDSIDQAMKNITRTIALETGEIDLARNQLIDLDNKKQDTDWLEEAEKKLVKLEKRRKDYIAYKRSLEKLEETIDAIEDCEEQMESLYGDLEKRKVDWEKAWKLHKKVVEREHEMARLENQINEIRYVDNALKDLEGGILAMAGEFERLMPDVCPLCGRDG